MAWPNPFVGWRLHFLPLGMDRWALKYTVLIRNLIDFLLSKKVPFEEKSNWRKKSDSIPTFPSASWERGFPTIVPHASHSCLVRAVVWLVTNHEGLLSIRDNSIGFECDPAIFYSRYIARFRNFSAYGMIKGCYSVSFSIITTNQFLISYPFIACITNNKIAFSWRKVSSDLDGESVCSH